MNRKAPSIRSLLASTVPNAPYAPRPERAELMTALRRAADQELTAPEAGALVEREDAWRAWAERRDALRSCILAHDLKATPQGQRILKACKCRSCPGWREELRALETDKGTQEANRV